MRAIENGGKTKQNKKKNHMLWEGEEGKHYKAGFGEKEQRSELFYYC